MSHPSKEYYINIGFSEQMAEKIIKGFGAPEDYPTEKEWLKMLGSEKLKYQ